MTMKTTLDILVAARALIEKPENWCQGAFSFEGTYCAIGAVDSIATGPEVTVAINRLCTMVPGGGVMDFNDTHTHPEVLALFDRAIAAEKRKTDISVFTEILNTAGTPKQPANV